MEACDKPHKARGWCRQHYSAWQRKHLTSSVPEREPFNISELDAAWLAGLFEGEGCISDHGPTSVRLTIQMLDEDIIRRVSQLTHKYEPYSVDREQYSKPMWYWVASWRPDVEELLHTMIPFFGERRYERALLALERLKTQTRTPRVRPGGVV